jgi:hypothetical protein
MGASVPKTDHPIGSIEESLNGLESPSRGHARWATNGRDAVGASGEYGCIEDRLAWLFPLVAIGCTPKFKA